MVRALKASRISRHSDDSTSLTRQDNAETYLIDGRGWSVVGHAVDDGVSASKVSPFDRPELGPWLTDPVLIYSYDVIVFWRLDRAVRSMRDLHELAGWAKDLNKKLTFTEGPGGVPFDLDMSNPLSALIMTVLAFAAEMEAQAIKERVQSSHDYLATQPRWASGAAPYGYRIVERTVNGRVEGKTLEVVPEQARILHEIADYLIGGESLWNVARMLNGVHTPAPKADSDYKEDRIPQWHPATLSDILRSERLLGYKVSKGHTVRTPEGDPVILADPIFDENKFYQLQQVLGDRDKFRNRTRGTTPLLGIVFCGVCGGPSHRQPEHTNKKGHKRQGAYFCHGKRVKGIKPCAKVRIFETDLMDRVASMFLENIGPLDRPARTFVHGNNHAAEMENIESALARLRAESDAGLVDDQAEYLNRLKALRARKKKLAEQEARPDRWEEVPSGKTWGQWWEESPEPMRRDLLLDAGFRVWLFPGGDSISYWPGKSGLSAEEFLESVKA
jgi:site-specific DNA recombinase